MIHAEIKTQAGTAQLRDATERDLDLVVRYFHRPDRHLDTLVDRAKIGTELETRARFAAMIPTGDKEQRRTLFAICLDGTMVGFSSLNRYSADLNYSHWHIVDEALRGSGLSTRLYVPRIQMYFELYDEMQRLVHQTSITNAGVNYMLDKFVPVARTEFVAAPDGVSAPGEYHLRFVTRGDISRLSRKARMLALAGI